MIDWKPTAFVSSSLQGYYHSPWTFEETVARIAAASGQPVKSFDEYKSSVDFVGTFCGQRFTMYDYKEDREIHIGGNPGLDVASLSTALTQALSVVEPVAYKAKEYYDEKRGHSYRPR